MTDEPSQGGAAPTPTTPPTQTFNIQPPAAAPSDGLAVAALVLGILALVFFWLPLLGWIPAILGLIFGLIAMQRPEGRGMAVAGVICSGIALAIKALIWIGLISFFSLVAHHI